MRGIHGSLRAFGSRSCDGVPAVRKTAAKDLVFCLEIAYLAGKLLVDGPGDDEKKRGVYVAEAGHREYWFLPRNQGRSALFAPRTPTSG